MFLGVVFFVFMLLGGFTYFPGCVDCWLLYLFIEFGRLLASISSKYFFLPVLSFSDYTYIYAKFLTP